MVGLLGVELGESMDDELDEPFAHGLAFTSRFDFDASMEGLVNLEIYASHGLGSSTARMSEESMRMYSQSPRLISCP